MICCATLDDNLSIREKMLNFIPIYYVTNSETAKKANIP